MNKQKLAQMRWKQVRISPVARRFEFGREAQPIDDVWLITEASREALEIRNPRSHQRVEIGTDHIREYRADIGRSDGLLILKSQVFLIAGQKPRVEPF